MTGGIVCRNGSDVNAFISRQSALFWRRFSLCKSLEQFLSSFAFDMLSLFEYFLMIFY